MGKSNVSARDGYGPPLISNIAERHGVFEGDGSTNFTHPVVDLIISDPKLRRLSPNKVAQSWIRPILIGVQIRTKSLVWAISTMSMLGNQMHIVRFMT